MNLAEILEKAGKHRRRKRKGRGQGSGHGKTAGRGHKGQHARSGWSKRYHYEGGTMTLSRRMPKRGFSNALFRRRYDIVNVAVLESAFEAGDTVKLDDLRDRGLVNVEHGRLKILGTGELTKPLKVVAHRLSESARQKIDAAGGSVETLETPRKKKGQKS